MKHIVLEDWLTTNESPVVPLIVEDDRDKQPHKHLFYEIFYILEGEIKHVLNDKDTKLIQGDVYFIRPCDMHYYVREKNNRCKHRDIVIRSEFFDEVCEFISPNFKTKFLNGDYPLHIHLDETQLQNYEKKVYTIINTPPNDIENKKIFMKSFLVNILTSFLEKKEQVFFPPWFEDLLARCHAPQYFCGPSKEILKECNYDISYICRVFKKYMKVTMTEYLVQTRLNYAANLLTSSNKNILSIAIESGFNSISNFNTAFKKQFKKTPSQFKKGQVSGDKW